MSAITDSFLLDARSVLVVLGKLHLTLEFPQDLPVSGAAYEAHSFLFVLDERASSPHRPHRARRRPVLPALPSEPECACAPDA
jgi:hypothetical protein